jgi:hypothetical protein
MGCAPQAQPITLRRGLLPPGTNVWRLQRTFYVRYVPHGLAADDVELHHFVAISPRSLNIRYGGTPTGVVRNLGVEPRNHRYPAVAAHHEIENRDRDGAVAAITTVIPFTTSPSGELFELSIFGTERHADPERRGNPRDGQEHGFSNTSENSMASGQKYDSFFDDGGEVVSYRTSS